MVGAGYRASFFDDESEQGFIQGQVTYGFGSAFASKGPGGSIAGAYTFGYFFIGAEVGFLAFTTDVANIRVLALLGVKFGFEIGNRANHR